MVEESTGAETGNMEKRLAAAERLGARAARAVAAARMGGDKLSARCPYKRADFRKRWHSGYNAAWFEIVTIPRAPKP